MLNHLEDYIARHAAATPDRVAVDDHGTVYTYGQLWLMVQQEAARLRGNGYGPGRFVFFRTSQDVHFIVTYLAVHLIQAVAAPMGKDLPEAQLTELEARYHDTLLPTDSSGMAGIADVLFTTGTTGAQKGVMLSHKALLADADNLIAAQGFCADTVFVIAGPLNHIGSLSKMWPVWVVGGSLVLLDGMRDLDAFFRAFDRPVGKMATFLVPTAIGMCLRFGRDRLSQLAHRIDFIEVPPPFRSSVWMDSAPHCLIRASTTPTPRPRPVSSVLTTLPMDNTTPAASEGRCATPRCASCPTVASPAAATC